MLPLRDVRLIFFCAVNENDRNIKKAQKNFGNGFMVAYQQANEDNKFCFGFLGGFYSVGCLLGWISCED